MNKFNLQLFADATAIKVADIQPIISYDHATRLATDLTALREILGIPSLRVFNEGSQVKIYETTIDAKGDQPEEGAVIPLTHVSRKLSRTIDLKLRKYRKETTVDAIQSDGLDNAVNETDQKLTDLMRQEVLTAFYNTLTTSDKATEAKAGANLQAALANAYAQVKKTFDGLTATPIYFVSVFDAAEYLGTANPVLAEEGGVTYLQNFLSLGTVVLTPELPAGTVYATAKENLYGAYVPVSGSVGRSIGATADQTGLVAMKHYVDNSTANLGTLLMSGVVFYPELENGIIKATISSGAPAATTGK